MTSSPAIEASGAPTIFEPLCAVFRRRLKEAGQKYTPERAQVLDAIIKIDDIFEADQLQAGLRKGGFRVSKATVYRTLRLLQDAGILQQVLVDSEQARYQLAYGRKARDLLVVLDSGEMIPIDVPELVGLRDRLCRERGLVAQGHRLQVFASRA